MRSTKATTAASASAITDTLDPSFSLTDSDTLPIRETGVDPDTLGLPNFANTDAPGRVHRVSPEMAAYIVRIKRLRPQITQQQIAALCGVSQPTVSQWLAALDNDTVPEARQLSRSQALRATMKLSDMVDHADPRVSQGAAKALVALAGVQEGSQPVQVGVQVIVGQLGQPAGPDPFLDGQIMVNSTPATTP